MSNPLNELLALYPDPMTAEDVQGLLSGSLTEVHAYLDAGELHGTKANGVWTVRRDQLGEFIGAHQFRAETPVKPGLTRFDLTVGMIASARAHRS